MIKQFISVKTVVAIGIGAALMFVLNRFAGIPVGVANTNIQLGMAILAVFAAIFGPIAGFLIGFIGHTLVDLTAGWGIWWSWITASGIFGLLVGALWKLYRIEDGNFGIKECLIFNGVQIAANILAYVFVARSLDVLIFREPFDKVTLQSFVASGVNSATILILGSLLIFGYIKTMARAGSLKKE